MKKFKTGLLALALVAGVAGAFATSPKKHHRNLDAQNWQTANSDGSVKSTLTGGSYFADLPDVAAAQDAFGCSGNGPDCAVTVTGENGSIADDPTYINHN